MPYSPVGFSLLPSRAWYQDMSAGRSVHENDSQKICDDHVSILFGMTRPDLNWRSPVSGLGQDEKSISLKGQLDFGSTSGGLNEGKK